MRVIYKRQERSQSGFTLVEVLAVVVIIGLLCGLLLPVLAAAREKARQGRCISNLRQLGQAFIMYMHDYEERPLRVRSLADGGYIRDSAILLCPNDPVGNWGGIYYDEVRRPHMSPDPIRYSYITGLSSEQWIWDERMKAGESAGIAICQLHGSKLVPHAGSMHG
jgi:prepilin-type N-terminal cleavage/methylation domain-containing protein